MSEEQTQVRYSEEVGIEVCSLIAAGNSLRSIGSMANMPSERTIRRWRDTPNHPFCPHHARALERQTFHLVDMMQAVNAKVLNGSLTPNQGKVSFNIMAWLAERLNPAVFSRRVIVDQHVTNDTGVMAVTPPIPDVEEWKKRKGITASKLGESAEAQGAANVVRS